MTTEQRLNQIESRLNNLQTAFLQSQRNQVPVTGKVDDTAGKVQSLTPYTVSQTAYLDDTSVEFTGIPTGNMTIYLNTEDGSYPSYTVERSGDRVTVHFEPLESVTTVTISII